MCIRDRNLPRRSVDVILPAAAAGSPFARTPTFARERARGADLEFESLRDEDGCTHESDVIPERGWHDPGAPCGNPERLSRHHFTSRFKPAITLARGERPPDDDECRVEDVDETHARPGKRIARVRHDRRRDRVARHLGLRDLARPKGCLLY